MSRAHSPNRRRRKGTARRPDGVRAARGVDPREQLATVLEGLVQGELGARQAQKQAYAIRSKVVIDMPRAVWRLLDSMAAEEQRGHRGVVFEGRTQLLTTAVDQLRAQVARGEGPPARPSSRRWRAWRGWVVGLAAVGWWVAVTLVDDGYYIGLTDDEGKLLAMAGFVAAGLWWLSMAARERYGTRRGPSAGQT
jgi:hypothetical protein